MLVNTDNNTKALFPDMAAATESRDGPGTVEERRLAETREIIEGLYPRDFTTGRFMRLCRNLMARDLSGRGPGFSVLM